MFDHFLIFYMNRLTVINVCKFVTQKLAGKTSFSPKRTFFYKSAFFQSIQVQDEIKESTSHK